MRFFGAALLALCGAALGFGMEAALQRRARCLEALEEELAPLLSCVEHRYLPLPEALACTGGDWEKIGLAALGEESALPPAALQEEDAAYLCACLVSLTQAGRSEVAGQCASIRAGVAALCARARREAASQGALWKSLATGAGLMLAILVL